MKLIKRQSIIAAFGYVGSYWSNATIVNNQVFEVLISTVDELAEIYKHEQYSN